MHNSCIFIWAAAFSGICFALPSPAADGQSFTTSSSAPTSNSESSPNNGASRVLSLQQTSGTSHGAAYVQALRKNSQVNGVYTADALSTVESGLVFTTTIEAGSQNFTVVVSTGSSDTWLVESDFRCAKGPHSACGFGPTYQRSSTFQPIPNENFDLAYADGEYLSGTYGNETVTVGGITVPSQQIALVNAAYWNGDGITSGVLGLSFPRNDKAYSGTDPTADSVANQIEYNPILKSMYLESSVSPIFSLALERGPSSISSGGGGYLAIGGLPPVNFTPTFATAQFQLTTTSTTAEQAANSTSPPEYTFYTIITNGFEYQGSQGTYSVGTWLNYFGNPNDPSQIEVIIDSSTTVIYLPSTIADDVNALFQPAAVYNAEIGYYVVPCNAQAPLFGVKIDTEIFYINSADLIVQLNDTTCISGVAQTAPGGNSILGHVFLKNVVAVFDIGAGEMRFAARENY